MVIDNLDVENIAVAPAEADASLVVDADAPLTSAVSCELLEPVAGRDAKKIEAGGGVKLGQLALGDALHILRQLAGIAAVKQPLGLFAQEVADHGLMLSCGVSIVKRG